MSKAFSVFEQNIRSTRDLDSVYNYISNSAPLLDASQLLRSEYALIISSLDKYIHDLIREKLVKDFFTGSINTSNPLELSLDKVKNIVSEFDLIKREMLLDSYIQSQIANSSFQSTKSLEYALSLINIQRIWTNLSPIMNLQAKTIKDQLAVLVDRRNKIVHEADIDIITGNYTPIDLDNINFCYQFVCNLVKAIESII